MLEQLLEMTSFNSQTCLTLGKEFIKYFSKHFRQIASIFLVTFITQPVYTRCTRINYKIVPVTNLNKYLNYGTNGSE